MACSAWYRFNIYFKEMGSPCNVSSFICTGLSCHMMLGIYFFGTKIGSSPFALFREQMPDLPVFQFADYATRIKDGNGLNMLLQNYWMVIHPADFVSWFRQHRYSIFICNGRLMTKKYGDWVKPALPWALFSACVLGVGVMMGGAWAYESLSFGGYWAWDPLKMHHWFRGLFLLLVSIHCLFIKARPIITNFIFSYSTYIYSYCLFYVSYTQWHIRRNLCTLICRPWNECSIIFILICILLVAGHFIIRGIK
jgi:cytochrome c biogenesis factor